MVLNIFLCLQKLLHFICSNDVKNGGNKQGVSEWSVQNFVSHVKTPQIFAGANSLEQQSIQKYKQKAIKLLRQIFSAMGEFCICLYALRMAFKSHMESSLVSSLRGATLAAMKQSRKLIIGLFRCTFCTPRNDVLYFSTIFKLPWVMCKVSYLSRILNQLKIHNRFVHFRFTEPINPHYIFTLKNLFILFSENKNNLRKII
ncbi:hypothetical protein [Candidatus Tisiphia endosymbiont of Hybos culiciformis]|uniref:hypothetical protein n=1 Tax=Candidatus Tisiphia endosymbiont of Hybos culiciformis TaxID=3139331 RepID=UPI003CCB38B0